MKDKIPEISKEKQKLLFRIKRVHHLESVEDHAAEPAKEHYTGKPESASRPRHDDFSTAPYSDSLLC